MRRFVIASLSATAFLIVAATAFAVGREIRGEHLGEAAAAQPTPRAGATAPPMTGSIPIGQLAATPTRPTIDPSTRLPDNPDTTKPGWFIPYQDADAVKPRRDQVINGIRVGPTVERTIVDCAPASEVRIPPGDAARDALALIPKYLPAGALPNNAYVARCRLANGSTVSSFVFRDYSITADPQVKRFGGYLSIQRWRGDAASLSNIPAERWTARTVAGRTAAVAPPILANGLGRGAVIIYADGIVTAVESTGLPLSELLQIAEGLY